MGLAMETFATETFGESNSRMEPKENKEQRDVFVQQRDVL
jgi:hypothetical protein